jgi:hypothetical protein
MAFHSAHFAACGHHRRNNLPRRAPLVGHCGLLKRWTQLPYLGTTWAKTKATEGYFAI